MKFRLSLPFIYALGNYFAFRWSNLTVPLTMGFIIVLPIVIGALGVLVLPQSRRYSNGSTIGIIFAPLALVVVLALILQWELLICIAMATPYWIALTMVGMMMMRAWLSRRSPNNQPMLLTALLIAPLTLGFLETRLTTPPDSYHTVHRQILIQADANIIWDAMTSVPQIENWNGGLYKHFNLPQPRQAILEGSGLGAVRQAHYTQGLSLQEPITEWQENELLAFDVIVDQASPDPFRQEGGANFDLTEVRFWLEPSELGIYLHLESSYRLSTPFNTYGSWWMNALFGDLQEGLLEVIQSRAEAKQTQDN